MADTSEQEGTTCEERVAPSPKGSPHRPGSGALMDNMEDQEGGRGDNCGTPPNKMSSPRNRSAAAGAENHSTDAKSSENLGGSVSTAVISPKHKDPDRIKKDREREERVRQARERLEGERKKKLIELREQQRQAQENREKQLEMRRKKIEDLRRRESERRAEVEKRRREKENTERSRRETLLLKAEERVARYEAWKRSGQKGGRGHVLGFGSATPRNICQPLERPRRSSSHSALLRHSPSGSDSDYSFRPQRRALSACSTVRQHCCVDLNRSALNTIPEGRRSVLAPSNLSASQPKSVMTLSTSSTGSASGVRLRENRSPRKPRPASVGTSMPSFVSVDNAKTSSPRSQSSDRLAREPTRPRGAVSASRAQDKEEEEKKASNKPGVKMSRKTLERLSTPRQVPAGNGDRKDSASTPRREPNLTRTSPRKAYSTSNLAMPRQKSSLREKTPKEASDKSKPQTPKDTAVRHQPQKPKETPAKTQPEASPAPSPVPMAPAACSTPRASSPASRTPVRLLSPTPGADEDGGSSTPQSRSTPTPMEKSTGDITAEEYKARLAEKRRQAREKAEKDAEEERKRQEEQERLEEEKRCQEEEEQRLRDEEALRLAEEARKAEEERLQKAIEAEEARRAEEAARLEQERLAKEEAERKAKEEAERLEQERQEKARREEEERLERKKRLEMIMKRVKTDNTGEGAKDSPRSVGNSPTKSATPAASSNNSPLDPENKAALTPSVVPAESEERKKSVDSSADESRSPISGARSPASASSPVPFAAQEATPLQPSSSQENVLEAREDSTPTSSRSESPVVSAFTSARMQSSGSESSAEKPKFKSPLLQKLVEGKDDASTSPSGRPQFKSPLLQNLLGKTRVGASMGLTQDYSRSSPDLSHADHSTNDRANNASPTVMTMSSSMIDIETVNSGSKEEMNKNEEKDVDTSEESLSSHSSPSHTSRKTVVSDGEEEGGDSVAESVSSPQDGRSIAMEISAAMEPSTAASGMTTSTASLWNQQDSGVSLGSSDMQSSVPSASLQVSLNGHTSTYTPQDQGLEDSSISMQSVGSISMTESGAGNEPPTVSPTSEHSSDDKNFEELIDLSTNTRSSTNTIPAMTFLDHSGDLVNFNKLEEESEGSADLPPPIIAFEEPSMMKHQDVSDLLS